MLEQSQAPTSAVSSGGTQPSEGPQVETVDGNEGIDTSAKAQPGALKDKAKPSGPSNAEKAESLRKILKREKDDPNVQFTDAELDLYDEYTAGKLKPAKGKPVQKAPEPEAEDSTEESDEVRISDEAEKPEEEAEIEDTEEDDSSEDEEALESDPDVDALMKEVGAKSLKDVLAKVKELRAKTGSYNAKQVSALQKQIQSEKALWEDVAKGVPAALAHAERVYGVKVGLSQAQSQAQPQQQSQARQQPQAPDTGDMEFVNEQEAIDPDSARVYNASLRRLKGEIDSMKSVTQEFQTEKARNREEAAKQSAQVSVIDEMVQVAQGIDSMKAIAGLREAIEAWYKGKPDTRIESFNELFDIAMVEGCNLKAAALIKRGRDADKLVAEAEQRGRKSAYGHKPNPSLSGQQGGKAEQGNYSPLTESQIEAMSEDHTLMPESWFDKDERPVKSKIPKKAHKLFGFD